MDDDLLDRAVELNRVYLSRGLGTAVAVGEYVLDAFFDGDLNLARANRTEHVSLRALGGREDLVVSHSFISKALRVLEQIDLLPVGVAESLTMAQHVQLLPVKRVETKVSLARKVASGGLSTRDFEIAVRRVRKRECGRSPRVGRPPLPPLVKNLGKLTRLVDVILSEAPGDDLLADFPSEDARRILRDAGSQLKDLEAYIARARAQIGGMDQESGV